MFNNFIPQNSCRLCGNGEKFCTAGQGTDDNLAHAYFIMNSYGYKHLHRICHSICFPTATMVSRTHLIVTLYVYCLYCCDNCHHAVFFVTKIIRVCRAQQRSVVTELQCNTHTTKCEMTCTFDPCNN